MTDPYKADQGSSAAIWLIAVVTLGGMAWFWLNMGEADFWLKVIAIGVVGVIWFGVVATVVGILAVFLGLGSIAVGPFRRK